MSEMEHTVNPMVTEPVATSPGLPSAPATHPPRKILVTKKSRRHSIDIVPGTDADMTMSTVQNGEEDDNWFSRGLILGPSEASGESDKLRKMTAHASNVVKESIEGVEVMAEQHEELADDDEDTALIFIYDSAAVCFHFPIFLKQMFINSVPFLACTLTRYCIKTNWMAQGYDIYYLWKKKKWGAIDANFFCPLCMITLLLGVLFVPENVYLNADGSFEDVESLLFLVAGSMIMPLILYIMHRVSIATKYATLSKTEYSRFMNCKSHKNVARYQEQMQLLSAWYDVRNEEVLLFEMQAAAVRVGLELRQVFFTIENPNHSEEAAYLFMQWQAMLLGLPSIKGLSHTEPHENLVHIMKRDLEGNYRVFVDDAALGILRWIENIGVIDSTKGATNFLDDTLEQSLAAINQFLGNTSTKKFGSMADSIEKFQLVILVTMSLIPFLFLFNPLHHDKTSSLWLLFTFFLGFPGFKIGISAFKLNLVLLRDTGRRIYEAHILSEMMRTSDFIHEFKFLNLAKNRAARESYLENSEIDSLGRSKNQLRLLNAGSSMMDVLQTANLEAEGIAIPDRESCRIDTAHIKNDNENGYFAARMPRLSQKVGGRANVIAWSYVRSMFRHSGVRYKLRIDILAAFTFTTFVFLFIITLLLSLLQNSNPALTRINTIYWATPLAYQVLLGSSIAVVAILANIAEAAKTNQDYSTHSELLTKHVMDIEGKFIKLSDSAILHSEQTLQELDRLRDLKDSIELTCRTTKIVDEQAPLTILGVPASWGLFSTILSITGTLTVSLIGFYTRQRKPEIGPGVSSEL